MIQNSQLSIVAIALSAASACGESEDDEVVEPGVIEHIGTPMMLEIPSSVRVGELFTAAVVTYGSECVSLESTDILRTETRIELRPYDRRVLAEACPANVKYIRHEADLQLEAPGTVELIIYGRKQVLISGERVDSLIEHKVEISVAP